MNIGPRRAAKARHAGAASSFNVSSPIAFWQPWAGTGLGGYR
jgi:hypothetical protein